MRTLKMLAALALLAPTATFAKSGDDGFRFTQKEWERTRFTVEVVVHPDLRSLRTTAIREGAEFQGDIAAFSKVNTNPNAPCRIHMVDPTKYFHRKYIGHELLHCMFGRWHQ